MGSSPVAAVESESTEAPDPPRALGDGDAQDRASLAAARLRSVPRPRLLERPLTALRGVGPRLAEVARELGIATLGDLLAHVPHGYREREGVSPAAELRLGAEATVLVAVRSTRVRPTRRRNLRIVESTVADDSGTLKAVWFNQDWLAERLTPGARLLLHGRLDRSGFRVSDYELLGRGGAGGSQGEGIAAERAGAVRGPLPARIPPGIHTTGIVPAHPASEGLRAQRIREWVWQALPAVRDVPEPLPARLRAKRRLPGAADALVAAHFPASPEEAEAARRRIAFEELFLHQAALATRRRRRLGARPGIRLPPHGEGVGRWIASLPFRLTGDQRHAAAELDADLVSDRPMQRLLMGEVGSGKTVVALYAMLRAVESGYQGALMAPTETLAEQHFGTLEALLAGSGLPRAALITGSTPEARRRRLLDQLASGELELVVGTHALIESDVAFARLALAVVDEQHRFGVRQRAALDVKGPGEAAPHALHMTATPIPRTLSLTAYGDLETTTIRELPAGRRPVRTWVVGEEKRGGAYEFIRERLREGRQAYVVCPLVASSETLQAKAAAEEAERLRAGELSGFEVALLHGQMPSREKAAAMERFAGGDAEVLVATTVIEVGVDVPNATVMLIEGAERYGLSQLHQLRGRVGRGAEESYCILFADPESEAARRRMAAIGRTTDGFELAEIDLTLRGEGEILGTRQHGLPRFRVAELPEDAELLGAARGDLRELIERHGSLDSPELAPLVRAAGWRFGEEAIAA